MCFLDQKQTVAIGEEEGDIPSKKNYSNPRCYIVHIASCYVSSLHNSLYNLTEYSHQAYYQRPEGRRIRLTLYDSNKWAYKQLVRSKHYRFLQ